MYEVFAFKFNLGHVSNAVSLWLGMRPSDIFVYVFFPPFLLDLASRLDFYMLKKVCCSVIKRVWCWMQRLCLKMHVRPCLTNPMVQACAKTSVP